MFAEIASLIATFMFVREIFHKYFPIHLRTYIETYFQKFFTSLHPHILITFNEFNSDRFMKNEAYTAIDTYLSAATFSAQGRRLRGDMVKNSQSLSLTMDDNEEVTDEFQGIKLWWASGKTISKTTPFSSEEKRYYRLKFHKKNRNFIEDSYLDHVIKEGEAIKARNRQRKLYTNNSSSWSCVPFDHKATFDTLAMEPEKKSELVNDLIAFSKAENHYSSIGRAWKRGYLLYGPPGTGKSTTVVAMANLLGYDIYDLELTEVKDNTELKRLLIAMSSKSIMVIEDIDCSIELTGQRAKKREKNETEETESRNRGVTLSGLLNFIDGIWSCCGGERLVVFTTNYVDKLDPALIRRGRMDKPFELSYCGFEGFKVLAKKYLDLETHCLFSRIRSLLKEVKITPADVAESLMPKIVAVDAESCLKDLILVLEGEKTKMEMEKVIAAT